MENRFWTIMFLLLPITLIGVIWYFFYLITPTPKPCLVSHQETRDIPITVQTGSVPVGAVLIPIYSSFTMSTKVDVCDKRAE